MFVKFKLKLDNWDELKDDKLIEIGSSNFATTKKSVERCLERFIKTNSTLETKEIMDNWFHDVAAHIFISHSHKDEKLILGLAGWFKEYFNLDSFVDSTVWGHSDELLKIIDDNYCRTDSNKYSYRKRNRTTTYVRMLLAKSLMEMIDKCELFIFIETKNSFTPLEESNTEENNTTNTNSDKKNLFTPSKYFETNGETESPWIFYELSLVDKIKENYPNREIKEFSLEDFKIGKFPVDLSKLNELTTDKLTKWKKIIEEKKKVKIKGDKVDATTYLDELYCLYKSER